jgi:ParB family chromosome partitioning protein
VTVIDHPTRTAGPQPDPEPTDPGTAAPPVTLAAAGRVLRELDPRQLVDNPLNPRADLGDLGELADSIRTVGVLEPLIVTPTDGPELVLLFGHRRRAAAIEAGLATVPCDVRLDYAGRSPEQLADMLAENLHRRDLTGVEEAGGYAQLAMFDGWTPERIAGRLGRPVERVRAGLAAAALSEELRPKVVDGGLTLEQAAAIEEFAGDAKAYRRLLAAANHPPGLHYALADERRKREVAERKVAARRELADAGVRIIAKPKDFPWSSVEARATELIGANGEHLTAEAHASCPGHAAFLDTDGEPVYVCQHPKDWEHGTPPSYRHRSKAEIQADEEAAHTQREEDQALAVADEARVSFLADYFARKGRPPAGTLRVALEILCRFDIGMVSLRPETGRLLNPEAEDTSAVLVEAVDKTADNRLPYLALAYAAAAAEINLRARDLSWRFDAALAVHWLQVIETLGYPLTEPEIRLRELRAAPLDDDSDLFDGADDEHGEDLPEGD